jgi:hypothetical protein
MQQTETSARSVAISRKVTRLLDVTANDSLCQLFDYVETACPQLIVFPSSTGTNNNQSSASPPSPTHPAAALSSSANANRFTKPSARSVLEDRLVGLHVGFLEQLTALRDAYQAVAEQVEVLERTSAAMEADLKEHRQDAEGLLSSVGVLRAEVDAVRQNEKQVQQFMAHYHLTADDEETLLNGPIDRHYLSVLQRVKDIHHSCRDLLAVNRQQAAVEIMESMYMKLLHGSDRLVKFALYTTPNIMSHQSPELTEEYIAAVHALHDRPAQRAKVLHEVGRVRKVAILRCYYDTLNRGGASVGRPLESLTHDPVRFYSELFAWLHQSLAEEGDLLDTLLLGSSSSSTAAPSTSSSSSSTALDGGGDPNSASSIDDVNKSDLMDIIFEVLCKHIRGRLDQTLEQCRKVSLQSPHAVLLTYFRLEHVFAYFTDKTKTMLGDSAALTVLLRDSRLEVLRCFYDVLKHVTQRLSSIRLRDVTVPSEVTEVLRTLRLMMEAMEDSFVPLADRAQEFGPILGAVIDPILALPHNQNNNNSAGSSSGSGTSSSSTGAILLDNDRKNILTLNILAVIQSCMLGFSFTSVRQEKITSMLDQQVSLLINQFTAKTLESFGFDERVKGNAAVAWDVLKQLFGYAATAGSLSQVEWDAVAVGRLREHIAKEVTKQVIGSYERLFDATPAVQGVDPTLYDPRKLRLLLDCVEKK